MFGKKDDEKKGAGKQPAAKGGLKKAPEKPKKEKPVKEKKAKVAPEKAARKKPAATGDGKPGNKKIVAIVVLLLILAAAVAAPLILPLIKGNNEPSPQEIMAMRGKKVGAPGKMATKGAPPIEAPPAPVVNEETGETPATPPGKAPTAPPPGKVVAAPPSNLPRPVQVALPPQKKPASGVQSAATKAAPKAVAAIPAQDAKQAAKTALTIPKSVPMPVQRPIPAAKKVSVKPVEEKPVPVPKAAPAPVIVAEKEPANEEKKAAPVKKVQPSGPPPRAARGPITVKTPPEKISQIIAPEKLETVEAPKSRRKTRAAEKPATAQKRPVASGRPSMVAAARPATGSSSSKPRKSAKPTEQIASVEDVGSTTATVARAKNPYRQRPKFARDARKTVVDDTDEVFRPSGAMEDLYSWENGKSYGNSTSLAGRTPDSRHSSPSELNPALKLEKDFYMALVMESNNVDELRRVAAKLKLNNLAPEIKATISYGRPVYWLTVGHYTSEYKAFNKVNEIREKGFTATIVSEKVVY